MIALDASAVRAARVTRGFLGQRGRTVVQATAQAPLPPGALVPAAASANVLDPAALRLALQRVATALELQPGTAVRLVLPDALARLVLLEAPRAVSAKDFARFRLAGSLPFGIDEAHVGALHLPTGGLLAAALARPVVAEYEALLEQAGWAPEAVVLGPLASLDAWLGRGVTEERAALVWGDGGVVLALVAAGRLRLVRSRLRTPGLSLAEEVAWWASELQGSVMAAGLALLPGLEVLGPGAAQVSLALQRAGVPADAPSALPGVPPEAADWAWLSSAAA